MSRTYAIDPNKLGEMLGIPQEECDTLVHSGDHAYSCRCNQCAEWWRLMGPDPDTEECGPFTFKELGLNKEDYFGDKSPQPD